MRMKYLMHNLIGHPAMAVLDLLGFHRWADRVHDATLPKVNEQKRAERTRWRRNE